MNSNGLRCAKDFTISVGEAKKSTLRSRLRETDRIVMLFLRAWLQQQQQEQPQQQQQHSTHVQTHTHRDARTATGSVTTAEHQQEEASNQGRHQGEKIEIARERCISNDEASERLPRGGCGMLLDGGVRQRCQAATFVGPTRSPYGPAIISYGSICSYR